MTPITVFSGSKVAWERIPDTITAHHKAKNSGVPNFSHCRIPVDTNLSVASWRFHLSDFFDQQLPDLIKFGFPLEFDRNSTLSNTFKNHASAVVYAEHADN